MKESYQQMGAVRERTGGVGASSGASQAVQEADRDRYSSWCGRIEDEGQFPEANDAFDKGVLTLELTRLIESCGKHWVSEIESTRHINWKGEWRAVAQVAAELRAAASGEFSFGDGPLLATGSGKRFWAFTKVVRLKRYGSKRLVIVHETADLQRPPRGFC